MVTESIHWKNFCLVALLASSAVQADADADNGQTSSDHRSMSVDEIAQELYNPVSSLFSTEMRYEQISYQGDLPNSGEDDFGGLRFIPSYPIQLSNGKNLVFRASIALVLKQPNWVVNFDDPIWELDRDYADFLLRQSPQVTATTGKFVSGHGHLGDIDFDVAYGGVSDSGFISMFGILGTISASQDISASRDQFLLGPEIALGKKSDWGIAGAWLSHRFDVSGDSSFHTNETWLKIFFAYSLGNGWQIISNPKILYDWEGDGGNKFLLPIGGGVAKTTRMGGIPIRFEIELQKYVVTTDRFGADWHFSFTFSPVFNKPFGK